MTVYGHGQRREARLAHGRDGSANSGVIRTPAHVHLLPVLALLLGAFSFFVAAPAMAQTTVWSATLTPADIFIGAGCGNPIVGKECSDTSILTDDDFVYDGTTFHIGVISLTDKFSVTFDTALPQGLHDATLNVGSTALTLASAEVDNDGQTVFWTQGVSGILTVGSAVSLSLVDDAGGGTPTVPKVWLSARPHQVDEGKSVTVTATLTATLANDVDIPLTLTDNTAEPEDHGALGKITITGGAVRGTGTITTNQDADTIDETFTIAFGSLPSSVTAGTPASVQITILDDDTAAYPDLVVLDPNASSSAPQTGEEFRFTATVRNRGGAQAAATTLRYYRSSDATIWTSDTPVGTDAVGILAANGTSAESIALTAPSTAGTYYYGACVDAVSGESDTGNNCSSSVRVDVRDDQDPPPSPDLEVGAPAVSDANPAPGAEFTLSATVRNTGDGAAAATTLHYYRSSDATISTSDTPVGTDAVVPLGAGGASAESVPLTAPSTAGPYYYGACVDAVSGESDTGNNCSSSVRVDVREDEEQPPGGSPDLEVGAPAVSDANPAPGAAFTLSATVRNTGDGAAAATTLRYYRSSDATISASDTPVGTDAVGPLGAAGASAESVPLTAPSTAGPYYYGACVDAVSGESDTGNNCSSSVRVDVRDDEDDGGDSDGDGDGDGDSDDGDSGDGDDGGDEDDGNTPRAQCPRPQESAASASISNRCDDFDEGYCHRRQLGEAFLRRNASSTVVLLESDADFDLCVYDRDRSDEWPKPIYVARKEDCVNYSLDSHGLEAQLTGKPEDHDVQIAELPDIARMDYCVVPFGDAVGRWDVRFHQPATLYGTVVPGSRRCPRWYSDNGETCASSGGSNYANLTVTLENCRGSWIDKGGSCDEPFVVMPVERADVADDGQEKCVVVNEDRTLRDVDGVRRPTLELAYCFFDDGTRRLGTFPKD